MEEVKKAPDRIEVLKKIEEYERDGKFDIDVENDPPTKELLPNKVDYLNKKLSSKIATKIAFSSARKMLKKLIDAKQLIFKGVNGIENYNSIEGGAIITCNHCNPLDSYVMDMTFQESKHYKKKKLYRIIREGNFTSFTGIIGFFMRHCNTLPLSSNRETMAKFIESVNYLLAKKQFILIYPEESMWWNYRKPKPLKPGAFRFAIKNDVPVLPMFITLADSDNIGPDGFPIQEYTVNILEPIYADKNKSYRENLEEMKNKNYQAWKKVYEDTYKIPLEYTTTKPIKY